MEDNKIQPKALMSCLSAIVMLLTIPLMIVFSGWTLSIVWNILIVKAFSLPLITVPKAISINLVISWLTYRYVKDERKYTDILLTEISLNFFFMFIAYVVSLFI